MKFFAAKFPKTLADANEFLRDYKIEQNTPHPSHTAAMQSVYKAVADAKAKQKADKQNHGGGGGGKQGTNEKNANSQPSPNSHTNCDSEQKPCEKPHDPPRVPNTPCKMCDSLGFPGEFHWHSKCPLQEEAMAILARHASEIKSKSAHHVHAMTKVADSEDTDPYGGMTYYANLKASYVVKSVVPKNNAPKLPEDDFDVMVDNQSAVDLFHNPKLLKNIRQLKDPETIIGLGGHTITVRQCGDLRYFGTVLYSAEAGVNVLSFGKSSLNHERKLGYNMLPDNAYWLLSQSRLFTFKMKNLNYVCDMRTNQPDSPHIDVHTVYTVPAEPTKTDSELIIKPAIAEFAIVPLEDIPFDTTLATVQEDQQSAEGDPLITSMAKPPDISPTETFFDNEAVPLVHNRKAASQEGEPTSGPTTDPSGDVTETHDKSCDGPAGAAAIAGVNPAQRHRVRAAQQQLQLTHEHDQPLPQAGDLLDPHLALPPITDKGALENHDAANINGDEVPAQECEDSDSDEEDEAVTAPVEAETAVLVPAPAEPPPRRDLTLILTEASPERSMRDVCKPDSVPIMERNKRDTCDGTQVNGAILTSSSLKIANITKPVQDETFRALRMRVLEWKDID